MNEKSLTVAPVMAPVPQQKWTKQDIDIIRESVAEGLSPQQFKLFMASAKALNLNPLARQIYGIPYKGKMVLQTSIDGYRTIGQRTGNFGGSTNPRLLVRKADGTKTSVPHEEYDPEEHVEIISGTIEVRFRDGTPAQQATATMKAYAKRYKNKDTGKLELGEMWAKMPDVMILKCAEAKALRQAFPESYQGIYIHEEMQQAAVDVEYKTPERAVVTMEDLKSGKVEDHRDVSEPAGVATQELTSEEAAEIKLEDTAASILPPQAVDNVRWEACRTLILKAHKVKFASGLTDAQWAALPAFLESEKFTKELQAENLLPMER
jgi:phage recombination protein Bet